ncbi:MAG TPA: hypothetical protein VGO71_03100 [Baekduia sp.]|jgi:hypothetical protein|nr:hypothetical protein [Baekduia sp.]
MEWSYGRAGRHAVRWDGAMERAQAPIGPLPNRWPSRPQPLQVLGPDGWHACGPGLPGHLGRKPCWRTEASELQRRCVRACNPVAVDADVLPPGSLLGRLRRFGLWWQLAPPMGFGSPRWIVAKDAIASFARALTRSRAPGARERAVAEATSGLERARDRLKGIEDRAATYVQAATLTSTLVLANGALINGQDAVNAGVGRWVAAVALVIASAALIVAGVYGLAAVMFTFDRVGPDNPARVIARSRLDQAEASRQFVAALLAAYRRTQLVADWKMARLKRATVAFLVSIAGIGVASGTLVVQAL